MCSHAAWSPDGRWMYFSSDASGTMQIWRQRFPDGVPEQITFPPTVAEGIAIAPDGRSLITSLGMNQRSVWVNDRGADRQVSSEGNSTLPAWGDGFPTSVFSQDGKKLYYLVQAGPSRSFGGGELWVSDLASGTSEPLLPGIVMTSFDLLPDGGRLVFAAITGDRKSRIWLAALDRRSAPKMLLPGEGLGPVFGSDNEIYFRAPEGGQSYLFRMKLDSGEVKKFTPEPAVNSPIASPDGQWIVSWTPAPGGDSGASVKAYPRRGGTPVVVCESCFVKWTRDRKSLFLSFEAGNLMGAGKTYVIALPPGRALPELPPGGVKSEADLKKLRVVRVIDDPAAFPGLSASTYAYDRPFVQRNLYRISLP
jgi:Tol biopolymer transport system component